MKKKFKTGRISLSDGDFIVSRLDAGDSFANIAKQLDRKEATVRDYVHYHVGYNQKPHKYTPKNNHKRTGKPFAFNLSMFLLGGIVTLIVMYSFMRWGYLWKVN